MGARDRLRAGHLATDPAWATNEARVRSRADLNAVVAGITSTRDGRSIEAALEGAGIAYARLGDVTDLLSHPQLRAPGAVAAGADTGGCRPWPVAAVHHRRGGAAWRPVPALGEHTEVVLRELGFPAERIAALRAGERPVRPGPSGSVGRLVA